MDHINDKIAKDYWRKKNSRIVYSKEGFPGSSSMDFIIVDARELSYFYKLTAENTVAEFTVLIALYNMLLQRYFEDCNVLSSKSFSSSQKMLLCYEFQSIGQKTIKEFIQETKEEVQEVYKYAPYYGDALIEQTSYVNYIPFQFNYGVDNEPHESYYGLSFHIEKLKNKDLRISLLYSEKFAESNIALHFLKNFKSWLEELEENINVSASKIPLISKEEEKVLLYTLNAAKCDYDCTITLAGIVERQANKAPQNIAVVCKETSLTYESLNEQANRLSHYFIIEHGISEGDFVGVKMERSEKLLIAILAVLKAGATYVPIDVNYPEERIAYIEIDSKCKLVIDVAVYNDFQENQVKYSIENPSSNRKSGDLAYIIYTSGTTGNPKGVMITHQNAVALIHWAQEEFNTESFDIVYAATSHCFDLSVYEMFYPLSVGKKIKILNNFLEIGAELTKDRKILLNTVPSSIRNILEEGFSLENVSVINLAGESFPVDIAKKLLQTDAEIRNLYGPSEDTTYSTCYQLSLEKTYQAIPIGKPITNTQAYILDEELQLVPAGIIGKLYLSGDGIAKGYLNQPELTSAKFIENPFEEGEKMYDTGDLVKWMPDGNLAFLGRKDHQIKLRGYRIELGEIENVMFSFSENILQAVVAVKKNKDEDALVGYYIENTAVNKTHLRAYLEKQLPAYMIPSYFIKVETVPLTPNGKVNKNALPEIADTTIVKKEYVAPADAVEKALVQIWEQTLGISPIGMNDHFFELGGHSLMISQIINAIYKNLHKSVPYNVFYTNPTISDLRKVLKSQEYLPIPLATFSESYPLTHSQNRLWLLSQLEGGNEAYQISGAAALRGTIDTANFVKAFHQVVAHHEILRAFFKKDEEGVVKQYIVPNHEFHFTIETRDFSNHESPYHHVQDYIGEKDKQSYNLAEAPLFRASLLKTAADNFVFYLSIHHLISDGWSLKVLTAQVLECYDALQTGGTIILSEHPVQFKDYTVWLQDEQKKESYQTAKGYWFKQFEETIPVLQLPGYTNRPIVKTYCGSQFRYTFSTELLTELKNLSKSCQVTLFTVLMTGVKTLLSRYSNQDDIIIGTPIAGREHPDLEHQIGLYINTLAIRTLLNQKEEFSALLQREGKQLLEAYEHQNFPFDALVEQLKISRDTSRSPLFDIMVVLQNQYQVSNFENEFSSNIAIEDFEIDRNVSPFDIVFTFTEKESLHLEVLYNTDLYPSEFIQGICKHLENLFYQVVKTPEMQLEEIELVSESEKETLLHIFNNTDFVFDTDKTIIDHFLYQVEKTPQKLAVIVDGQTLSYAELDELSNRLANYLIQNYQITPHNLVAVKLDRGERLIISLLGILKTGAAYVPIDTNYPENRIKDILDDVAAKAIIDDAFLDDFYCNETSSLQPKISTLSTDLAYVIYTSGSTGKPKGVMITHQSLVNLCFWHKETYSVKETSKGTLFSGVAFDASVWEIYPYLMSGATLYPIQKEEIRLQIPMLASFLQKNEITHAYLPSRICQDIMADDSLELSTTILTGGERLNYSMSTSLQIYNNYGPTENTVVTTYYDCKEALKEKVSIGKPIANTKVYILSENLKLQPIGVIGELCISGIGLSKGYLHQPELTAEKFISNPFSTAEKLYKTGDLARWLPDGNLEFIGRKDNQVKIRGNRVELAEIEHVIREYDTSISNVLVLVKEVNHEQVIVAYYKASASIDKKSLRDYLKEQLADYMMPGYYIALEKLPLNANGKVDITNLPVISEADVLKKEYVAPSNETEAKIAVIWQELLGHQTIGLTDDFFELGGHSLLLTKLLSEYQKIFKISVDLKTLYANTSLKSHAVFLNDSKEEVHEIEKAASQKYYDLSPSQIRYWLLYKIQGKSREFNIYSTLELPDNLNVTAFEAAFNVLLERHEILRSVFVDEAGIPKQKVLSHLPMSIPCFESESDSKREVFEHEFDLETYPLFKVAILKEGSAHKLFFNIHHSISDGWSMGVISRDLMGLYTAIIAGKTAELPELSIQYKDYAQWQNKLLQLPEVSVQENYWKGQFAGPLPYLQLPSDYTTKLKTNYGTSSSYTVYITEEQKKKIEELSWKKGTSVFAVFVAALKILLFRLTSEEDIIIGIPVANRNHYQLKDLVGCFINTLMLRDKINEAASFQTWLQHVNETLINALSHQNYPFEQLLEQLNVPQKDNRFPLSPVFLNMVDFDAKSSEVITDFSPNHEVLEATPKFDIECYIKSFTNGYKINWVYDHELFKKETIQYWINAYLSIINQIIADDEKPLYTIKIFESYINQEEDLKPTNDFDYFEANEIQQSIAQRFEKQVERFPNHPAVYANQTVLTYRMLNNCANHLAQQINEKSNQSTQRIALLLNHNETCVIGMLGVLKAGYAYVPIDSNSPLNRIQYIIEDSGCDQLVCNDATIEKAQQLQQELPQLSIIKLSENYTLPEISNPKNNVSASAEAYVLYTSGSTGMPKGVLQNQRNVLHFIRVYTNNVHIAINDNLSVFSTYTFDASVKDIYGAILNGATVSIYDIVENGLDQLSEWLFIQNITIIHMVPTIYRNFLKGLKEGEVLSTVRLIDLGGESCHKPDLDLFKKHFLEGSFLVNDYGPTESTIVTQKFLKHTSELTRNNLPLGKAVEETSIFLLDENNQPKGVYQTGEIVFKSNYLSLGYLNRQELTKNVFITDPVAGGRVYKSGDIGKMLSTGEIEFLQRKDSQVKLNGLRIELSEIEYQLEQIESIKEAVVLLKELQGNSYITAYIRVTESLEATKIKMLLGQILPKYMIPTIYITLEEFPLTRSGKIERKSLQNPMVSDLKTVPYVAPKNDIESKLATIWAEVLKLDLEIVGTEDNFFELGGNSLQAVVLINKINKTYNTVFSIANLYETLNIRDLSVLLNFSILQNQEFDTVHLEQDQDEIVL